MSTEAQLPTRQSQTPSQRHKAMDWVFSLIPDVSLNTANKLYTFGWVASLIGAAITLTGVIFLMWGTRVRDHDFESKIATLNSDAASARERAENIKAVVAWREVRPEEIVALQKVLSAEPGAVNLRYTDGDPEALYLATQISNVLAAAKWKIASGSLKLGNALVIGIALPDDNADGQTLRAAFTAANIPFATQLPQLGTSLSFNVATIQGAPTLVVGSRPPPKLQ